MMAGKLLILLLGNRLHPATMLAHHIQPSKVACIGSIDRADTLHDVEEAINYLLSPGRLVGSELVPPYRVGPALKAIETFVRENSRQEPVIGLTGCPLPMSIAAYEAARRLARPALYVNTVGAEIVDFTQPDQVEPLRVRFELQDYLAICGLRTVSSKRQRRYASSAKERAEAACKLAKEPRASGELISWTRFVGLTRGQKHAPWPSQMGPRHFQLLQTLASLHIIEGLAREPSNMVTYRIPTAGEARFLDGEWLEQHVFSVAEKLRCREPSLFDSLDKGLKVRAQSAEREIDFIALRGGVPLIATCKSGGDPWQKEYLDEIAAVARLLGGNYCIRLFITNQLPPQPTHSHAESRFAQFQQQATGQRVVLITGRDFDQLGKILREEMLNPTYQPV